MAAKILGGVAIVLGLAMFTFVNGIFSPLIVLIAGGIFLAAGFMQQG
jgi:ABC-type Mn2+/Zn2+ transport system permease subunit